MDGAARLRELLGPRHPVAVAAVVRPGGGWTATLGTDADGTLEIGSVSKGVTGLLYADAIGRGEITAETTLGELLPLGTAPAAAVRLADVATHRSGLPGLPKAAHPYRRSWAWLRHGANPYGDTLAEVLEQARTAKVGSQRVRYSNFGFELLGHAVAAAAGTRYADLVAARVAEPLGLRSLSVPATPAELGPHAVQGTNRRGRPTEAWTGEGLGPAGGIRASVEDLRLLVTALLDGTAPGMAALDPVAKFAGRSRIGTAWVTMPVDGRTVTCHDGGTGGFRSWLGLDREAGVGVAVVTATTRWVSAHGRTLLTEARKAGAGS